MAKNPGGEFVLPSTVALIVCSTVSLGFHFHPLAQGSPFSTTPSFV